MNPYIAPVYITSTNMVIPIVEISFKQGFIWLQSICDNIMEFVIIIHNFIIIMSYTIYFIIKQLILETSLLPLININFADKIIIILSIY
jgi:hypothetical protein